MARLKPSTDEMSGFGAPFCTATPIDDVAMSTMLPATILPLATRSRAPDADTIAISAASPSPSCFSSRSDGPSVTAEAIAGGAFEGRRQLLEHRLHRRGAEHLDVDGHYESRPWVMTLSSAGVPERTASKARLSAAGRSPGSTTFSPTPPQVVITPS